jgi:hypothetical protein
MPAESYPLTSSRTFTSAIALSLAFVTAPQARATELAATTSPGGFGSSSSIDGSNAVVCAYQSDIGHAYYYSSLTDTSTTSVTQSLELTLGAETSAESAQSA